MNEHRSNLTDRGGQNNNSAIFAVHGFPVPKARLNHISTEERIKRVEQYQGREFNAAGNSRLQTSMDMDHYQLLRPSNTNAGAAKVAFPTHERRSASNSRDRDYAQNSIVPSLNSNTFQSHEIRFASKSRQSRSGEVADQSIHGNGGQDKLEWRYGSMHDMDQGYRAREDPLSSTQNRSMSTSKSTGRGRLQVPMEPMAASEFSYTVAPVRKGFPTHSRRPDLNKPGTVIVPEVSLAETVASVLSQHNYNSLSEQYKSPTSLKLKFPTTPPSTASSSSFSFPSNPVPREIPPVPVGNEGGPFHGNNRGSMILNNTEYQSSAWHQRQQPQQQQKLAQGQYLYANDLGNISSENPYRGQYLPAANRASFPTHSRRPTSAQQSHRQPLQEEGVRAPASVSNASAPYVAPVSINSYHGSNGYANGHATPDFPVPKQVVKAAHSSSDLFGSRSKLNGYIGLGGDPSFNLDDLCTPVSKLMLATGDMFESLNKADRQKLVHQTVTLAGGEMYQQQRGVTSRSPSASAWSAERGGGPGPEGFPSSSSSSGGYYSQPARTFNSVSGQGLGRSPSASSLTSSSFPVHARPSDSSYIGGQAVNTTSAAVGNGSVPPSTRVVYSGEYEPRGGGDGYRGNSASSTVVTAYDTRGTRTNEEERFEEVQAPVHIGKGAFSKASLSKYVVPPPPPRNQNSQTTPAPPAPPSSAPQQPQQQPSIRCAERNGDARGWSGRGQRG